MRAIHSLPHTLYRFYDAQGRLLYIGIAVDFLARWGKHRKKTWWPLVARMEIEQHPNRAAACAAERKAIILEKPLHNYVHNKAVWGSSSPTLRDRREAWSSALHLDPWPRATTSIRAVRLIFLGGQIAAGWFLSAELALAFGLRVGFVVFACWLLLLARLAADLIGGYQGGYLFRRRRGSPSENQRWRILRAVLFVH